LNVTAVVADELGNAQTIEVDAASDADAVTVMVVVDPLLTCSTFVLTSEVHAFGAAEAVTT
jgi:hypothetical protein